MQQFNLCTSDRVVGHQSRRECQQHVNGMHSSRLLPLLVVVVAGASLGTARAEDHPIFMRYTCSPPGNYTNDSPYAKNLAELLPSLSTPAPATVDNWWFGSRTVGTGPDQVSGLAMCYADSKPERCLHCLAAINYLNDPSCDRSRHVSFISTDGCVIRYADTPFFGSANADDSGPRLFLRSNIPDDSAMREARRGLLSQLAERAGSDALRFATGSQEYVDVDTVIGFRFRHVMYGIAQCTRDLPLSECTSCLLDHLAAMYRDVEVTNSTSASLMGLSCYLAYQLDEPIDIAGMAPAPSPAPTTAESPTGSSAPPPLVDRTTTLFAALAAAVGAVTLLNVGV